MVVKSCDVTTIQGRACLFAVTLKKLIRFSCKFKFPPISGTDCLSSKRCVACVHGEVQFEDSCHSFTENHLKSFNYQKVTESVQ